MVVEACNFLCSQVKKEIKVGHADAGATRAMGDVGEEKKELVFCCTRYKGCTVHLFYTVYKLYREYISLHTLYRLYSAYVPLHTVFRSGTYVSLHKVQTLYRA